MPSEYEYHPIPSHLLLDLHSSANSLKLYESHEPSLSYISLTIPSETDMSEKEGSVFHALLHPDDIYTEEGVYWADLPVGERIGFVRKVDSQEARKEGSLIWNMFKTDPLSPIGYYFKNMVLPGAGLGLEG